MLGALLLAGCTNAPTPEEDEPEVGASAEIPAPTLDFAWTPVEPQVGQAVSFSPAGTKPEGTTIVAWEWAFGDGTTSASATPLHRFTEAGLYQVTARMTLDDGQSADADRVVRVVDPPGDTPAPDGSDNETDDDVDNRTDGPEPPAVRPEGLHLTDGDGEAVAGTLLPLDFALSDVGEEGPEPSVGITSSGCIFFTALEKVMRSCDGGGSWDRVDDVFSQAVSFDPYLWVDPATDRIFNVQMGALTHAWVAWSDDDGGTWLGNPYDQGPLPVVDHIKLGSGPWTEAGYGAAGQGTSTLFESAVYFCYNKLVGVFCYTSFDGGASFPVGGQVVGLAGSGGLHGAITSAPDGTVYVPPRVATPTVYLSKDNGLTWESRTMGQDVGTPDPRKNSEVGTDSASNAYHVWVGADSGVYMSRSTDSGLTWEQESLRVSPLKVVSSTFPHIDAGDPGRIAVAYLGSTDAALIGTPDIDGEPWEGNPHTAPDNATYHLYVSYSLNALDDDPTFTTVRVTSDPVQAGSICISSGDCRDIGGSNRNLLDFNDLHIDRQGRVYVAYADGCTDAGGSPCASDPEAWLAPNSRDARGAVAYLRSGPSLYESVGGLAPIRA